MGKFLGLVLIQPGYFSHLLKDDPVRPHLDTNFRLAENRLNFISTPDHEELGAVVCVALTRKVPTTEKELEIFSLPDNPFTKEVAIFYTIWSYTKGSGKIILFDTVNWLKKRKPSIKRFVTMSPKTEMARKFHTKNGASELSINEHSINFEYVI